MTPRLLTKYTEEVRPHLNEQFQYKNVMEIPRLAKVVINIGVNEAKLDQKYMDASINELTIISGQKPVLKRAKKSIAGFNRMLLFLMKICVNASVSIWMPVSWIWDMSLLFFLLRLLIVMVRNGLTNVWRIYKEI